MFAVSPFFLILILLSCQTLQQSIDSYSAMKQAREEIVEVQFKGNYYFFSILEKQNDSGIMFNDRLFFLCPDKCIGYLSQPPQEPSERINFDTAKVVLPISQVKTAVSVGREIHIKVVHTEGSKKIQKEWILRTSTEQLAKRWYDRLHHQKMKEALKRSAPKTPNNQQKNPYQQSKLKPPRTESRFSPPKKVLQITRSQSFSYHLKPQSRMIETGVGVGLDSNDLQIKQDGVQKKEVGTAMSQKSISISSVKHSQGQSKKSVFQQNKQKSQSKKQKSESNKQKSEYKRQKSQSKRQKTQSIKQSQPKKQSESKKYSQQKANPQPQPQAQAQRSTVLNQVSKEPINEGKSDNSFADNEKIRSVRSEPMSRKVELFKVKRNDWKISPKQQQIVSPPPSIHAEEKDKSVHQQNHSIKESEKGVIKPEEREKSIHQSSDNMQTPAKSVHASQKEKSIHQSNQGVRVQQPSLSHHSQHSNPRSKVSSLLEKEQEKKLNGSGIKSIKSLKKEEVQQSFLKELSLETPPKEQEKAPPQENKEDLGLSNKRYISQEEFDKLNTSSPAPQLDRTAKLIKDSSSKFIKGSSSKQFIKETSSRMLPDSSRNSDRSSEKTPQGTRSVMLEIPKHKILETKRSPSLVNLKSPIPEVKEEYEEHNESQQLHKVIKEELSSIQKEPQVEAVSELEQDQAFVNDLPLPWTYRYLREGDRMFSEFQSFCLDLLGVLLEDLRLPANQQQYRPKLIRGSLFLYEVEDVQVKLAMMPIEDAVHESYPPFRDRVCSKQAVKALQNQFNTFHLLYQHLSPLSRLRVPLICLCKLSGFVGLFKVLSVGTGRQVKMRDLEEDFAQLRASTKVSHNFFHNHNKNILQLDQAYYKAFHRNTNTPLPSLNCYMIQEVEQYLPADNVTNQQDRQGLALLRSELITRFAEQPQESRKKPIQKLHQRAGNEVEKMCNHLVRVLSEVVVEIDSLSVYFLDSLELKTYLHGKGVNLRYLGHLYEHLQTAFQQRVLMSEMAARSCKALFCKTLQDLLLEEETPTPHAILTKACDFLNCVTGNTLETAALWKVLSAHSLRYFGVQLNFQQIQKGFFLVSLVQNCRLGVVWEKLHPLQVFKEPFLFTDKNLVRLETCSKIYHPHHNPIYTQILSILAQPHSQQGAVDLMEYLERAQKESSLAEVLNLGLGLKAKLYLSLFVSPKRSLESGLKVYGGKEEPSRSYFQLLLMEIKWELKEGQRDQYIRKCDQFIRAASRFYGEFHPIFSDLYDVFSSYHQCALQFQDAVTFAKSSLVNTLKVCGTAHERTSECYYNLALCYIKANRKEEAFAHIRKAKSIFEANGRSDSLPYAAISLKLALLYLNQDQTEHCLAAALAALEIFEREPMTICEEEVVDCYQMVTRCYEILQEKENVRALAKRCEGRLEEVVATSNLQRMLKLATYPLLAALSPEQASLFLDILAQLPAVGPAHSSLAQQRLRTRISESSLLKNLAEYTESLVDIESYLREGSLLQDWVSFGGEYPRETIDDFVALSEQLVSFLGEGFLSGALREAL